jgi:hypothetical protein
MSEITPKMSGEVNKTTLKTSGEVNKTTLQTSGEDVKPPPPLHSVCRLKHLNYHK